jgi:hypothetical protein
MPQKRDFSTTEFNQFQARRVGGLQSAEVRAVGGRSLVLWLAEIVFLWRFT